MLFKNQLLLVCHYENYTSNLDKKMSPVPAPVMKIAQFIVILKKEM